MVDRYKRQEMIKDWDQEVVSKARILVVGAGTTGNEVIKNLALLGVGEITIVDSDIVEEVNLSRCVLFRDNDIGKPKSEIAAKRAVELNPHIKAVGWNCDIIYDVGNLQYSNFDCIILTVDNLEARLWVNRYCWLNNIPLIDTGIEGLLGNVFVMVPPFESCIECGWSSREYQRLTEKHSCSKIGLILEERKIPMVITSAAVIGGIAVQEIIRILQSKRATITSKPGIILQYNGESSSFLTWQISKKEACPAHNYSLEKTRILFTASLGDTVECLKERVRSIKGCSIVEIWFDKEIVYSVVCNNCNYTQTIDPCLLGKFRRFPCPHCAQLTIVPDDHTEELRDGYTIKTLSIPQHSLLRVTFLKSSFADSVDYAWVIIR